MSSGNLSDGKNGNQCEDEEEDFESLLLKHQDQYYSESSVKRLLPRGNSPSIKVKDREVILPVSSSQNNSRSPSPFTPNILRKGEESSSHTREEFASQKDDSQHRWSSLPDSINGTLIYFFLVEQNNRVFPVGEFFEIIFLIGLPVYLSFYMQAMLIYWIYVISPDFADSPMCAIDGFLQHAVICVFFLFMFPSFESVVKEAYVVLYAERVGFTHDAANNNIYLYDIRAPYIKRLVLFILVVFIEGCILSSLYVVGSKFIVTSQVCQN